MAEWLTLIFILIGILFVYVIVNIALSQRHTTKILNATRHLDIDNVQIRRIYGDYDSDSHTYKVTFTDDVGNHYKTICKGNSLTGHIYWSKSPTELMLHADRFSKTPPGLDLDRDQVDAHFKQKATKTNSPINWQKEDALVKREIDSWNDDTT